MSEPLSIEFDKIAEVLVATARGDFSVRVERTFSGDSRDVLAFLVNQTAEEVERLVGELETTRQKLNQAEKLAALGELAGGVAHELNQPLTVMQTLADLLLEKPERTVESRRSELELIRAAASRMGRIVGAIRTFGRSAPLAMRVLEAPEPLEDALHLMQEPLRIAEVALDYERPTESLKIRGDSEALQQVFINLLSNARDVLAQHCPTGGRRIRITVGRRDGRVRYEVTDSGPGIPEHVRDKIFDPFFTTKTVGKGTGLGLAISHGIASDHAGTLSYLDAPSGGARFVFDLPEVAL